MALSSEVPDRAKKFRIYKNGDKQYYGKEFVFNKRRVRTWDSFLQQVTNDLKYPEAVRTIRTPIGGTRVTNLDQLDGHEDKQSFVAVGNTKFRKDIRYLDLEGLNRRNHALSPRIQFQEVKPVEHSRIQVSGKIRKIPTDVLTIYVYSNGNNLQQAKRVTLTRPMLQSWNVILQEVTDKVGGLTSCLYTLDGQRITNPAALQKGNFYVAVDKKFKKLDYGSQRPGFNTSPKQRRKLEPIMAPRRGHKLRTGSEQTGSTMENSVASSVSERSPKSFRSTNSNPVHNRPAPNRKPLPKKRFESREKEEDSVFHAKPVKHKRHSDKQEEIDYDKDQGGIFKAKGGTRETRGAEEVEDTRDTQVDLPIDQVEAEEIQDEDIEGDYDRKPAKNSRSKQKKRTKTPPSKSQSRSPSLSRRSPSPEQRNESPKQRTPTPPQRSPTPQQRSPTPKQRTPTPVERTPTPAERSPTPAERSPTPAERSPTPAERTPTPAKRTPSPRRGSQKSETPDSQRHKSAGDNNEDDAAVKIQSNYRGYQARKVVHKRKKQNKAAVKIQANYRGYKVRKDLKTGENRDQEQNEQDDSKSPDLKDSQSEDEKEILPVQSDEENSQSEDAVKDDKPNSQSEDPEQLDSVEKDQSKKENDLDKPNSPQPIEGNSDESQAIKEGANQDSDDNKGSVKEKEDDDAAKDN